MTSSTTRNTHRITAIALGLMITAGISHASGFDDPESLAWKFRYGLSSDGYHSAWNDYKASGYIPIDVETDDSGKRFSGVWQKNTDGRGWGSWRRLSSEGFHSKWDEYKKKGYRPIDQDAEVIGGKLRYSLVMVENKEKLGWISRRNLSSAQFSKEFKANKGKYRPLDVDAVEYKGDMLYSIIWIENKPNTPWAEFRDMTPESYGKKFKEYSDKGYRVAELDCYKRKGKLNYAAVWEKNQSGRSWAAYRQMSATGLRNKWHKLADQGMRVIDIEKCPALKGGGSEYAAVFRENDDRYDWAGRKQAEQILATYTNDAGTPSVGAAIVQNGRVLFRAGSGFADKDNNVHAHGGTVYRLASIAKAVTGTLAYDLEHAGIIDLDDDTDSIVPGLGSRHTHTVRQLLKNTSCVKHYTSDGLDDNGTKVEYATALTALNNHLNGALKTNAWIRSNCSMGDYNYSTHGYTLAAAALERRAGSNFSSLVKNRLADPMGLSTLRVEKRSSPKASGERATINSGANVVSSSQYENVSWKPGGSGMESSALDLARFGDAVVRNRYFPLATRNTMWSGTQEGQANGWRMRSAGTRVTKSGGNQGSNTYIEIDIVNGITVVALTNTRSPSSGTSSLTSQLLALAQANPSL